MIESMDAQGLFGRGKRIPYQTWQNIIYTQYKKDSSVVDKDFSAANKG